MEYPHGNFLPVGRYDNGTRQSGNPLANFDRGEIRQSQSVLTQSTHIPSSYSLTDWTEQNPFLKNRKIQKTLFPEINDAPNGMEMDISKMVKVRGKKFVFDENKNLTLNCG